jgi:hypothetical protein
MMPDNWAGILTAGKDERKDFLSRRERAKNNPPPPCSEDNGNYSVFPNSSTTAHKKTTPGPQVSSPGVGTSEGF